MKEDLETMLKKQLSLELAAESAYRRYKDMFEDKEIGDMFARLADDEKRHAKMVLEILRMLDKQA